VTLRPSRPPGTAVLTRARTAHTPVQTAMRTLAIAAIFALAHGLPTVSLSDASSVSSNASMPDNLMQDGCTTFTRESMKYNLLPRAAVEAGMEAVQLMAMAYEYKTPGYNSEETWGDAYPPKALEGRLTELVFHGQGEEGSAGFVGLLDGNTPVLGFAGSSDWTNAYHDAISALGIDVYLGEQKYTLAKGFAFEYEEAMATLESAVAALINKHDKKLLIVGHSLGGSMAAIAAVALANKYEAKVMLRTAGAPRAFAWAPHDSAEDVQQSLILDSADAGVTPPASKGIVTQRWVNRDDVVPTVPLCKGGFMHIGNGGFYLDKTIFGNWNKQSSYGPQHQDFTPWQGPDSMTFRPHFMFNYYSEMKESLNGGVSD